MNDRPGTVPVSVITLNAGRDHHLLNLAAGVGRCRPGPEELVVVTMGAPPERSLVAEVEQRIAPVPTRWLTIPVGDDGELPLAAARNAGAAASTRPLLVYLDVDCIPEAGAIGRYAGALDGPVLVAGPVRWLERWWDHDDDGELPSDAVLRARSAPHPARPTPVADVDDRRHELFWSLAFGVRRHDLDRIGGFDEGYVGYGGEDTDLGLRARAHGLAMRWTAGGAAFHQWHPTSDPPFDHLDAIVRNATRFHATWGRWPMEGWLEALAAAGVVDWRPQEGVLRRTAGVWRRARPTVLAIPSTHPYVRHVLPDEVDADPDPTRPWWPHPALEPEWVERHVRPGTVVHLHFGYEHRTVEEMRAWCDTLRRVGARLVVTIHDVDNPHCTDLDQPDHHRRCATVVEAADAVLTLTAGAADQIARRWGRCAVVLPHPHVAAVDRPRRRRTGVRPSVGVDLKALRAGLLDPSLVLRGLARGASTRADAIAWLEPGADRRCTGLVEQAADEAGVELRVEPAPDDAGLADRMASLDVAVLPYRTGTHSGILELCRDVGTRAVVPADGGYQDQWEEAVPFVVDARSELGAVDAVARGVRRALELGPVPPDPPGWRAEQRDELRRAHLDLYRRLAGVGPS